MVCVFYSGSLKVRIGAEIHIFHGVPVPLSDVVGLSPGVPSGWNVSWLSHGQPRWLGHLKSPLSFEVDSLPSPKLSSIPPAFSCLAHLPAVVVTKTAQMTRPLHFSATEAINQTTAREQGTSLQASFASSSEPITGTVIYPFVNQFVRATGVTNGDERKTGYYAGLIESVFFLAEALTVFQWGWLSDQLGRKPVLLLGPFGLVISMLGFGLSKSFASLLIFRSLQGVFNGNIGVSKSVLAEASLIIPHPLVRERGRNEHRRALLYASIHVEHGHYYRTLPSAPLRQRLTSKFGSKAPRKHLKAQNGVHEGSPPPDYSAVESSTRTEIATTRKSTSLSSGSQSSYRILMIRPLLMTYLNYIFIAFNEMAHNSLLPLMYSSSIPLGGLGLDAYRIGVLMGAFGLANAVLQLKYLGKLTREFGPKKVYIFSYGSFLWRVTWPKGEEGANPDSGRLRFDAHLGCEQRTQGGARCFKRDGPVDCVYHAFCRPDYRDLSLLGFP
ncbi:hypothetical protein CC1G_10067 [Coprinopsis cinerea okayama7|uniref:Major facilitator superfamily (MFS) profile domain-containing protein n=1 Tax=Coprinopsis cinerea (strain Okayama-7 / 130 / ATCC MYA-4618 / FGSC 9003) TaxID=240176 RepID=A8NUZ9_COPC7|nr:hypothetical protein CC1G_10067 [Coprinopsis cinerea okayama7\|eukprot:XP_001836573.2 hypothetical protein CC1G_10067 [Coprinopsis cinerea okayama7\